MHSSIISSCRGALEHSPVVLRDREPVLGIREAELWDSLEALLRFPHLLGWSLQLPGEKRGSVSPWGVPSQLCSGAGSLSSSESQGPSDCPVFVLGRVRHDCRTGLYVLVQKNNHCWGFTFFELSETPLLYNSHLKHSPS